MLDSNWQPRFPSWPISRWSGWLCISMPGIISTMLPLTLSLVLHLLSPAQVVEAGMGSQSQVKESMETMS